MKQIFQISLLALLSYSAQAQDFLGISTGNYAGITGVALQPASIVDSRYKFDLNLTSLSLGFKSNFIGFDRTFAVNNRFNLGKIDNFYDFRAKTLSQLALKPTDKGYANITNTVQIPLSFMMSLGRTSAIALNMRSRTAFTMNNLPQAATDIFFKLQDSSVTPLSGIPFNADNMAINGVSWLDVGLTYAQVLVNSGSHFVKAGVTGKYIGGLSSFNIEADKLTITPNNTNDIQFNSNNTYVKYSHSPTNFSVKPENYRPDASSFGFDAGIVYEFRGRINKFKLGKLNDAGDVVTKLRQDKNKYTFRLGASLLDAGKMTFFSSVKATDFSINPGTSVNFPQFIDTLTGGANFDDVFNSKFTPKPGQGVRQYSIALPTSLNVQLDLHILKGLYVNAMVNRSFKELNKTTDYRTFTPEYICITPRFETRFLGLYVPILQNNQEKDWRIGTTLRLGPVFAGTNNLSTLFKSTSINEADIHAGLKLPIGYGRPSKAFQNLKNLQSKVTGDTSTTIINNNTTTETITNTTTEESFKNNDAVEAKMREMEAKLKAAQDQIAELEKAKAKQAEMKATEPANATPTVQPQQQQPRIIINNYNTPGAAPQSIEMDGSLNNDIEELKKKIELKEKLIEELKKADKSTGCVELKKKLLA